MNCSASSAMGMVAVSGLVACDGGTALPSDPDALGFVVDVTGATSQTLSQDNGTAEINTFGGTLNLVFRNDDVTVGLNFANTATFATGEFDASSILDGTGDAAASFSAVDSSGDRITGLDPDGPMVIDEADVTLAGTFELTFNLLGEDGTVDVSGEFRNIPNEPPTQ